MTSRQTVLFRRGALACFLHQNFRDLDQVAKRHSAQGRYPLLIICSMPHKVYHGKTGVVYNVTKSAVGVIVYKKVKHRYIEKRVNLRVEHVSLSRSREEFVRRVKVNAELKKKSKAEGTHVHLKRQPLMPREARTISMKENVPETVVPIAYETTI